MKFVNLRPSADAHTCLARAVRRAEARREQGAWETQQMAVPVESRVASCACRWTQSRRD